MSFALSAPISLPLSEGNPMSIVVAIVGALAVASAFDLSSPHSGTFRVSTAPIEQVLAAMGNE
jgi:hypothetical protein